LSMQSDPRVEIHPIGRGVTIALNGLWSNPCPFLGS
jgi:hypothetical protein